MGVNLSITFSGAEPFVDVNFHNLGRGNDCKVPTLVDTGFTGAIQMGSAHASPLTLGGLLQVRGGGGFPNGTPSSPTFYRAEIEWHKRHGITVSVTPAGPPGRQGPVVVLGEKLLEHSHLDIDYVANPRKGSVTVP